MRIKVLNEECVFHYPDPVYVRVFENIVPNMTNQEKNNMCTYLDRIEKNTADQAIGYINNGAYKQAKDAVSELADVIERYREVLGCYPTYVPAPRETPPAGIA